jgi:hypothetical protein
LSFFTDAPYQTDQSKLTIFYNNQRNGFMKLPAALNLRRLSLVALTILISACFNNPTRYTEVPTAIAAGIEFSDRDTSSGLSGKVTILAADDGETASSRWTFDNYIVRWAIDGIPQPYSVTGESNLAGQLHRTRTPLEFEINRKTLPEGINSLVVYTSNALGSATEGFVYYFDNLLIDPRAPQHFSASVGFVDTDESLRIKGRIGFGTPAEGDSDIRFYTIRFAGEDGCPLDGDAIAKVNRVWHASSYGYNMPSAILPPAEARSITVIPGNQYADAYALDCAYPKSNLSNFNRITPTDTPYYQAERITFVDTNESADVSGTLTIYPSIDERDLSTGYYLEKMNGSDLPVGPAVYFPKTGGPHTYQITNASRFARYRVSTGKTPADYYHRRDITLGSSNIYGTWFTIKNKSTDTCIRADSASARLSMAECDANDIYQRFNVSHTTWSADPDNDDYHHIESVAFPGRYFNRAYTADGAWFLGPLSENWSRVILTGFNSSQVAASTVNKEWKKMAIINIVAGSPNYACASMYFTTLQSSWGNCGGILAGSFGLRIDFLQWKFTQANGTVSKFNDL